jgi:hypothetical protein
MEASVLQSNLGGHCRTNCGKLSAIDFLQKIYKKNIEKTGVA